MKKFLLIFLLLATPSFAVEVVTCTQPGYVVRIAASVGEKMFEGKLQPMAQHGTGSIVRKDLVLTAQHVIDGILENTPVRVAFKGGPLTNGKIVKESAILDLALILIEETNYPILKLSLRDPTIGQKVTAGGFPRQGPFSCLKTKVLGWYYLPNHGFTTCFMIEGAAIKGMSGGPIINKSEELVGTIYGNGDDYTLCPNISLINKFIKELDLSENCVIIK